jgi:hypothetical protein
LRCASPAEDREKAATATGRLSKAVSALCAILDRLFGALFQTHFGLSDLTDEGIDHLVGHTREESRDMPPAANSAVFVLFLNRF